MADEGRSRRGCRWSLAALLRLLLGLLVVVLGLPVVLDRPQPETIPDLRRTVADERNAVPAIVAVMERAPALPLDQGPHYPWPRVACLNDHVRRHEALFAALDQAAKRPELVIPPDCERLGGLSHPAVTGTLGKLNDCAKIRVQRAYSLAERTDWPGAFRELRQVLDLGRRVAAGTNMLNDYVAAVGIEAIAVQGYVFCLGQPPAGLDPEVHDPTKSWPRDGWPAATQALWAEELRALLLPLHEPDDARRAFMVDYPSTVEDYHHCFGYDRSFLTPGWPVWHALPHRSVNDLRREHQRLDRQFDGPYWERERKRTRRRTVLWWNEIGDLVNVQQAFHLRQALRFWPQRVAQRRLLATAVATKLYLERHGRLPATLQTLVSAGLLPAVPQDPYSGRAPLYAPSRGLLYAAGPNGKDDRGFLCPGGDDVFLMHLAREMGTRLEDDLAVPLPFVIDAAAWYEHGYSGRGSE